MMHAHTPLFQRTRGRTSALGLAVLLLLAPLSSMAKDLQTEEQPFIQAYSGKSRQFVAQALGEPLKKEQAIKPHNANEVIQDKAGVVGNQNEPIEMWYYKGKIQYAPNKFFNMAELTFANDKCVNITFANKK